MENSQVTQPASKRTMWLLSALGLAAIALGLWDLLIERDGGTVASLSIVATGVLVILIGTMRRRS